MKAVIVAGGKGKRLGSLTAELPKPMICVAGKPLLEHQVDLLRRYGITDIHILTGHLGPAIEDYFGNGESFGVTITCLRENYPLGTAGCVKALEGLIKNDFLLLYGDIFLDLKLDDFIGFHEHSGGAATLVIHPSDHPYDSDLVSIDGNLQITGIHNKPHDMKYYGNNGSAAVYVLSPSVFKYIQPGCKSDFMKDIFPAMLSQNENLFAYKTAEYVKDMGTKDRLKKVETDYLSGKVKRMLKEHPRPAIFMDRDGTLIQDVHLLHKPDDLELFDYSSETICKINRSGYLGILITNQPVVARNLCDISTVNTIHNKLETLLGRDGCYLDDIFFCPHHPDKGYPEENTKYKIHCDCRKPETGMIDKAVSRYNVDIELSWLVGDTTTDLKTGSNAGLKTVLVRTGKGGKDGKYRAGPDFTFGNLKEAVDFILVGKKLVDAAAETIISSLEANTRPSIILVGGPARSGKSTFVMCLAGCLRYRNRSFSHISLDNWIIPATERTDSMTVRQRYRYRDIERDVETLLHGGEVQLRVYDPFSREAGEETIFTLEESDFIIIEGVPALDLEKLRQLAGTSVYCELEERERKDRFFDFYRWKDFPEDEIVTLYNIRLTDELSIIENTKGFADFVVRKNSIEGNQQL